MDKFILLLIPLVIIDFILRVVGLIDIFKEGRKTRGPRIIWIIVVLIINYGSVIYLLFGRDE